MTASSPPALAPLPGAEASTHQVTLLEFVTTHERLALAIVFVAGLLLRITLLADVPNTVTADELDFGANALQVLAGKGPAINGLDWTPEPALSVYFIVWSWQLLGVTLFTLRLPTAIISSLAILPFYALARRRVSAQSALVAAILFAGNWWFLHFSRSAWNNADVVTFSLLAGWLVAKAGEEPARWRYWVGLGVSVALLLYGYFAGRAVVIAICAYLVVQVVLAVRTGNQPAVRLLVRGCAVAAGVAAVLFFPEFLTFLASPAAFDRRVEAVWIAGAGSDPVTLVANQAWDAARSFLFLDPTLGSGRYKPAGTGWLDPLSGALYLAGLVLGAWRWRQTALWWTLLLVPLALTQLLASGAPDGARGITAVGPMFLFASLAIELIWNKLHRWSAAAYPYLVTVAAVLAIINTAGWSVWVQSEAATTERMPGIASTSFGQWRDFQQARLRDGLLTFSAGEFDALTPDQIAGQIAGSEVPVPVATPVNGPRSAPIAASGSQPGQPTTVQPQLLVTIGQHGTGTGQVDTPIDVAFDTQGNVLVLDAGRKRVERFSPAGAFIGEFGGPGSSWKGPWALASAGDGTLYILDTEGGTVSHVSDTGSLLGAVEGLGDLTHSRGLTLGSDGMLSVAGTPANEIFRFSQQGIALTTIANTAADAHMLDQPTAAISTTDGSVYVYEPDSGRLLVLGPNHQQLISSSAPRTSTLTAGGLALLADGRLLLADHDGHRVLVYDDLGNQQLALAMPGSPTGIATAPSGQFAVVDADDHAVRIYNAPPQ